MVSSYQNKVAPALPLSLSPSLLSPSPLALSSPPSLMTAHYHARDARGDTAQAATLALTSHFRLTS